MLCWGCIRGRSERVENGLLEVLCPSAHCCSPSRMELCWAFCWVLECCLPNTSACSLSHFGRLFATRRHLIILKKKNKKTNTQKHPFRLSVTHPAPWPLVLEKWCSPSGAHRCVLGYFPFYLHSVNILGLASTEISHRQRGDGVAIGWGGTDQ